MFDPYFDDLGQSSQLEPLQKRIITVIGETASTKYTLIGSNEPKSKTFQKIDFGPLPVSTIQYATYAKIHLPQQHRFYSSKNIRIKNTSSNFAYFSAVSSNSKSEVAFHPKQGIIEPDGGVLI